MKTLKVMIFDKMQELFFHLVDKWNEIGSQACQSRGLSPQPFFTQLSQNKEINFWDKTHIFMVDERFISPFHKESNQRISLTLPVINHSRNVIFLVTGKEKASIIHQVLIKKSKNMGDYLDFYLNLCYDY